MSHRKRDRQTPTEEQQSKYVYESKPRLTELEFQQVCSGEIDVNTLQYEQLTDEQWNTYLRLKGPSDYGFAGKYRWALYLGTTLEYFDMYLFIHMAVTLSKVFFSATNEKAVFCQSLLAGATWILRILGGYLWGKYGDKVGRKKAMYASLGLMAFVSWGIAFCQDYETWGIWASCAIVFLRLLQGYAGYGEFLSSVVFLTEKSGVKDKDKHTSFIFFYTIFGGGFLAIFVMQFAMTSLNNLPFEWWRGVYFISGGLAILGLYLREKMHETSIYLYNRRALKEQDLGFLKTFKKVGWKKTFAWAGMDSIGAFGFLFIFVFLHFFLRKYYGYSEKDIVGHNQILYVVECIGFVIWIYIVNAFKKRSDQASMNAIIIRCGLAIIILLFFLFQLNEQGFSLTQITWFQCILLVFFPCPGFALGTLVSKLDNEARMTQYGALSGCSRFLVAAAGIGLPFLTSLPPKTALFWGILIYLGLTIMAMIGLYHLRRYPDLIEKTRRTTQLTECRELYNEAVREKKWKDAMVYRTMIQNLENDGDALSTMRKNEDSFGRQLWDLITFRSFFKMEK